MPNKRPDCSEFILAAIRKLRQNPKAMKPGIKAGIAVRKIFSIASEIYTPEEFREALQILLTGGIIILTWQRRHVTTPGRLGSPTQEVFHELPEGLPIDDNQSWCRNMDGIFFKWKREDFVEHDYINSILLYIVSDGLHERLTKVKKSKAEEIITSMKKT